MILKRFFKPKPQDPKPETRIRALASLSGNDAALLALLRNDPDPLVRQAALAKVTNLLLLEERAAQDADPTVQAAARERLRVLLTGTAAADSPPLAERLAFLDSRWPTYAADLVGQGKETELRLAALAQISDLEAVRQVAMSGTPTDVQLAALARLVSESDLETVARHTRNRNKRVYRAAQERLDVYKAERERLSGIEQICTRMEALAAEPGTGPNDTRFHTLEKVWNSVEAHAPQPLQARYQQARAQVTARTAPVPAAAPAPEPTPAPTPAPTMPPTVDDLTLQVLLLRLEQADELTPELSEAVQAALAGQDDTAADSPLIQSIRERERQLHGADSHTERLQALLQQAEALGERSQVRESDIKYLQQQWKNLERPAADDAAAALHTEFNAVIARLRHHLHAQDEERERHQAELNALVDELEKFLTDGELQHAIDLDERIRQRLRDDPLPRNGRAALERRLQTIHAHLGELRGWRRWGAKQARDHLCEEAEQLADTLEEPPVIAKRVQQLRAAWKALDHSEGAASKALWERFNAACERAYAPCQAYFAAQAEERQANLAQKQQICQHLEDFEAATDWDNPDWRATDRTYNDALRHWSRIGPVDRAARKEIERRFQAAIKRFDQRLATQRSQDRARREALIQQVEALVAEPDVRAAVDGAKHAQADWQPTVLSSRRQEQALWRRFRAACDAIFERRKAEHDAIEQERQASVERKTALCEELEQLAAGTADLAQSRARRQAIEQEWRDTGPVPQAAYRDIERRFQAACQQFEQRERAHERNRARRTIDALQARAALCTQIEALLAESAADAAAAVAAAKAQWDTLPPVAPAQVASSEQRFEVACQAVTAEDEAVRERLRQTLAVQLDDKQRLCLRLEIIAGVDSPPAFAKARLEYQVSRLSESLTSRDNLHSRERQRKEALEIETRWYLTGVWPPEQAAALDERFARALHASQERLA